MKKMWKRTLAMLLAVILLAGASPIGTLAETDWPTLPAGAAAAWWNGGVQAVKSAASWLSEHIHGLSFWANAETVSGTCGPTITWTADSETGVLTIGGVGAIELNQMSPYIPDSYRALLTEIHIGYGITGIGDGVFADCTNLTRADIPGSINRIGAYAFAGCGSLQSIALPDGLEAIGERAFSDCCLQSVVIPANVTEIGAGVFAGCPLTSVTLAPGSTCFCTDARGVLYDKDKTHLIQYPAGNSAASYSIPGTVTGIGDYAFFGCRNLTGVSVPNGTEIIGSGAFEDCTGLTRMTIPNSVEYIGSSALWNCSSLTHVKIGNGVSRIGEMFAGCSALTDVEIAKAPVCMTDFRFFPNLAHITIGDEVREVYVDGTIPVSSFTVSANNPVYSSDTDGVLYNLTKTELISYPCRHPRESFQIPYTVQRIGPSAFRGCHLTGVTIPNTVKSIGEDAFRDSRLTSVAIPSSVTSIGEYAFADSSLTGVTIPGSLKAISACAFCGAGLTSVTIPGGVTSIGESAFAGCCDLTDVTLPGSLTLVGYSAFDACDNLTTVHFAGTMTQWCGISFEDETANPASQWDMERNLYIGGRLLTDTLTVPNGATEIGSYTFNWRDLTEVTLPVTLTHIGECAFEGCPLTNIYYLGNENQWYGGVQIDDCNDELTEAQISFFGQPIPFSQTHTVSGFSQKNAAYA